MLLLRREFKVIFYKEKAVRGDSNKSGSAILVPEKMILDSGFYSSLSTRIRRKYDTERYLTVLTDIYEVQLDLFRYFVGARFESQCYKDLEAHWIIHCIVSMCSELSNFQEELTSNEKKVLTDNSLLYYKWYVAPMVLPLSAMCMLGYLDQTIENDQCMPSEKSHLEMGYRLHQVGDYTRQIENLYILFNELRYNSAEMSRQCPGVNLFDHDGR